MRHEPQYRLHDALAGILISIGAPLGLLLLKTVILGQYSLSRRYRSPLSVLLVDVDQLKRVNDIEGHAAGDQVIRAVARAITKTSRQSDIGGRWGGDEFLIIAPDTAGSAATTVAERLRAELDTQAAIGEAKATVSVGVATFDPSRLPREDTDALLRAADAALYRAKAAGRNQVRVA